MTWRVYRGAKLIKVGQQTASLRRDCTINARLLFTVGKRQTYTATFALNDSNGNLLNRRLTIRGT